MKLAFAEPKLPRRGVVAVPVMAGGKLGPSAAALDKLASGAIARAVKAAAYKGNRGTFLAVHAPAGLTQASVLLLGVGKVDESDEAKRLAIGAALTKAALALDAAEVTLMVDALDKAPVKASTAAAQIAHGARLRAYRFDKYRTRERENDGSKPKSKPKLAKLTFMVAGAAAARRAYGPLAKVADAVDFARDLVSEPGNVVYPETLAAACRKLTKLGVKVEVLGESRMAKLGMGALLGVGQGSARESQLVVMQWQGGRQGTKPVAFVGKGVTFDTGGISIKPAAGMDAMKWDMGGAGAVIGLMHALAGRKAKANVVGVVGLVENMPSGKAQRPGDIVTSMSGQTIEVLNTDAEGRLVLADAMWYAQDRFQPKAMVDLATLTGAIMVALGMEYGGLYANDDDLAEKLAAAGGATGEKLWRMPLDEAYDRQLDGGPADVKNIGGGRWGGSITAAQFLQRFTNKTPWAHLDIAGVAWNERDKEPIAKGASGFGVRLLDRFVHDTYEGK